MLSDDEYDDGVLPRMNKSLPKAVQILGSIIAAIALLSCQFEKKKTASQINPSVFLQSQANLATYKIAAGDILHVQVLHVDDLERKVRVDQNGIITLPLIGELDAAGKSVANIEQEIAKRYDERYLHNPQISVFLEEQNANRITVTGAVSEPGIYRVIGGTETLQQAVAQAKGINPIASRHVVIFRSIDGKSMMARFDLNAIEQGRDPDPQLVAGDIVVVFRSNARFLLRTIVDMTPFVMVWRAYR